MRAKILRACKESKQELHVTLMIEGDCTHVRTLGDALYQAFKALEQEYKKKEPKKKKKKVTKRR